MIVNNMARISYLRSAARIDLLFGMQGELRCPDAY